ncbi:MAG: hypothetical protein RLZZ502_1304, partial [Pseudomonadota bacterium]
MNNLDLKSEDRVLDYAALQRKNKRGKYALIITVV